MTSMDGARRELTRLRAKLRAEDREFRAAAPPVDESGLPDWDGSEPLSPEGYAKALDGAIPDADLAAEELEARTRLSPYSHVFERLARDATEKEAGP